MDNIATIVHFVLAQSESLPVARRIQIYRSLANLIDRPGDTRHSQDLVETLLEAADILELVQPDTNCTK